jgi:23S rRNA (guanosine2251-2'-O)-methyltransferase
MPEPDADHALRHAAGPALDSIASTAAELHRLGWAEANAGNLSIRLGNAADLSGTRVALSEPLPALRGHALLVSVAGARMRDIAKDPLAGLCLVRMGSNGSWYEVVGSRRPTSELPVHLAAQQVLAKRRPQDPALLHSHPPQVSALTLVYPEPETLVSVLVRAHSEMSSLRGRLQMLPFFPPGSAALARATAAALAGHSGVVWSRHGMVASGQGLAECLDLMQFCEKAAEVALLAGLSPRPDRTAAELPAAKGRSLKGHRSPDGIETFYDVRSQDSSLSLDEFRRLPRRPVHLVLDNLRSAFNVGAMFRLADAARLSEIVLCGYTAHPPHRKLEQTALGATATVPWRRFDTTAAALAALRSDGTTIVGAETKSSAVPYHRLDLDPESAVALVFGNEALGLSQSVLGLCDGFVRIPVFGYKNSLNVAVAASILVYHLLESRGRLEDETPVP